MTETVSEEVLRFDLNQRVQHILLILSFVLLALTGLPQSFSHQVWAQTFISWLGGLDGVRLIHHLSATVMAFLFFYHLFWAVWNIVTRRWRRATMLPRIQDLKDGLNAVFYLWGRKSEKPQYDRFDFRQKLEYWSLIWGTVLMGLTGIMLMFPEMVASILPGDAIYAAKAAHGLEALLAILSIVVWHMYNTHLAEDVWPIDMTFLTGKISRERLQEEHPLEYQRLIAGETPTPESNQQAAE